MITNQHFLCEQKMLVPDLINVLSFACCLRWCDGVVSFKREKIEEENKK